MFSNSWIAGSIWKMLFNSSSLQIPIHLGWKVKIILLQRKDTRYQLPNTKHRGAKWEYQIPHIIKCNNFFFQRKSRRCWSVIGSSQQIPIQPQASFPPLPQLHFSQSHFQTTITSLQFKWKVGWLDFCSKKHSRTEFTFSCREIIHSCLGGKWKIDLLQCKNWFNTFYQNYPLYYTFSDI